MKLRPYQSTDHASIVEAFGIYDKVLYQLPTGAGKTVLVSHFVEQEMEKEKKFLILVHKERLLRQMVKTLKSLKMYVGSIIRDEHINLNANCIVASVSTVMRDGRIDLIKDRMFDYIVIDEAHHSATPSFTKVVQAANHGSPCKILGVTATPYRSDERNLADYFDHLILSSSQMNQLIQEGWLSKYRIFTTPVKEIKARVNKSGSDYKISDLSKYMRDQKMVDYLVESYKKNAEGRKMISFCVDTKHARQVQQTYVDSGYNASYIDANTPQKEREEIISQFQSGEVQIIVCIETLSEGVDIPECDCIQLARPTLSIILYLQFVGRGLRPKPDGSDCIILDNAGLSREFGLPDGERNWQLDSGKNPVIPGDKILVVKRKDGSYDDDLENNEFDEIVEMTYEEFISQSIGTIEQAQQHNKNLRKRRVDTFIDLTKEIIKLAKFSPSDFEITESYSFSEIRVCRENTKDKIFSIEFKHDKILLNVESYYARDKRIALKNQAISGKIANVILSNYDSYLSKVNRLMSIEEIDISSLRDKIKEKKFSYYENLLKSEIEKGKVEFDFSDCERSWGVHNLKSTVSGRIKKIKFVEGKFKKWNLIQVVTNWDELLLKDVQSERIIELFVGTEFEL